MRHDAAHWCGAIYNAAWQVRYSAFGHDLERRERAVRALGLVIREAFAQCDDFEPLIHAVAEGVTDLRRFPDPRFVV